MATRPKAVIESRNGEKLSPITIAKNVLTDDGQNLHDILSDRKEDMMTPTIENSNSMFKIGQGDNVDYSSNVVNGAYESMVLKGKSMVNCIQESSSQDVVLPYEFADGQHVTINDTKESGALSVELKGQTLVNLLNKLTVNADAGQTKNWYAGSYAMGTVKSGKYILFYNVKQTSETNRNTPRIRLAGDKYLYHGYDNFNTTTGIKKWIFTANTDLLEFSYWVSNNTGKVVVEDFILLEYQEGMENWDIPYFEGMTSCKMPTLHTVGKNLYNINKDTAHCWQGTTEFVDGRIKVTSTHNDGVTFHKTYNIPVKKGRTYYVNVNREGNGHWYLWKNGDTTKSLNNPFTVDDTFDSVAIGLYCAIGEGNVCYFKPQIEEGTVATTYEDHKTSILSLPEEVVLRSLPNGVCDTFNTRTGIYTQRIGEVVLDGSDSVNDWMFSASNNTFRTSFNKHGIIPFQGNKFVHVISDKYTTLVYADDWNSGAFVSMDTYNRVVFRDDRFSSLTDWHNSLKQNAITVQYILETPVVTKINLSSTLKSWNTTTHIYSEIPENTLYPILSHSNPSYPVILKPSTKYSIVANSYSNGHTNSTINFNLGGATASTTVGNRVTTITTPSTLSNELLTMSGRGNKLNNVMVIEGDVIGDEPYFEGICDCKSPILSNVGKNLFNTPYFDNMDNLLNNTDAYVTYKVKTIKLKPNTVYTFSHEGGELKSNIWSVFNIEATSENKIITTIYNIKNWSNTTHQKISPLQRTFKSPSDGVIHLSCYSKYKASGEVYDRFTEDGMFTRVLKNIQLEETSTSTQYESYKSNTTIFDQKDDKTIVLRSLPNGVCDTLNVETGEYVQRIGELVLDGSEQGWILGTSANWYADGDTFGFYFNNFKLAQGTSLCIDKFLSTPNIHSNDMEGCYINTEWSWVGVRIYKTKLPSLTVDAFKQWLSQNHITIQYRLATPIVKTVDLSGYPFSYENGHVQLSSGSIEQSLTPKVEYSVVTNRNGQIRSNQKMVERHQKQLDRLQTMILTNLVNTQYEQTLTNLKYDLKNVRKEVK